MNDTEHYIALRQLQAELNENTKLNTISSSSCLWHLSSLEPLPSTLKSENIVDGRGFERLIVEKPFGTDYETASKLNEDLLAAFDEEQSTVSTTTLGKEMIQSIFAVRFVT